MAAQWPRGSRAKCVLALGSKHKEQFKKVQLFYQQASSFCTPRGFVEAALLVTDFSLSRLWAPSCAGRWADDYLGSLGGVVIATRRLCEEEASLSCRFAPPTPPDGR